MVDRGLIVGSLLLWLAAGCLRLQAHDLYVAPDGTAAGPGTVSQPYDLVTALSGQLEQVGTTFWLRGGDYSLGHLDTIVHGARGRPVIFRGMPGENARIDGSLTLYDSIGYVVFRDFELYSSDANRVSQQRDAGFGVTDISIVPGIACYAPNLSFINLVIHDHTRHGIYISPASSRTLVHGCILYNNGWVSPDNAEGHGLYVQGEIGGTRLADNIVFNNSGANLHVYENADGGYLRGITLDGNVAFNAGAIQRVRSYRDWIAGVDAPAVFADRIVLKNNMGYQTPELSGYAELQVGRDSINRGVILTGNYMPMGLMMNNWRKAVVTKNLFGSTDPLVAVNQELITLRARWDNNTYISEVLQDAFVLNAQPYSFSEWRMATRFDAHSKHLASSLHGTTIFLRRNVYQRGRANLIVYNWDGLPSISVDVRSVLPRNQPFELRNAQDFLAPPVLSGTFVGQTLEVPMTNLAVARVNAPADGALFTPPPTGPVFNVFVLLPQENRTPDR